MSPVEPPRGSLAGTKADLVRAALTIVRISGRAARQRDASRPARPARSTRRRAVGHGTPAAEHAPD